MVPWGLALPDWSARPQDGDRVTIADRTCRLGARPPVWLSGDGVDLGVPACALSRSRLWRQLVAEPRPGAGAGGALRSAIARAARERLDRIVELLLGKGSMSSIDGAVLSLAGLGQGSTPTGDDLLVGVAAAAFRFDGAGHLESRRLDALRAAMKAVPATATTAVASEMHRHASEGRFLEPLRDVARAMGADRSLADALQRLRAVGSQSGVDLARGALALARAFSGEELLDDLQQ